MMKLLAKVKTGTTMIKKSYKVTNRLNCRLFHNSYHKRKKKSRFLRLIVLRIDFIKNQREILQTRLLENMQICNRSSFKGIGNVASRMLL